MKKIIFTALICCTSLSIFSAYKGSIFIENTKTPLANVMVTDGQNVVKTDKNGKFTLPGYSKTRFITITTPAGYSTPQYYIPINDIIKSYDFSLRVNDKTKNREHSFIQITDTEIHGTGVGIWASYLRDYIHNEQPAFLIHTGDICYDNGLKMHIKVVNSETMNCPVYYGIGNHDLTKGAYGEELFESIYGPTWYSFDVGNTHYIMTPMAGGDHAPSYDKQEVYNWLKNDLAMIGKDKSLIVFNHDILTTEDDFIWKTNNNESLNFRDYNIKAWIYGHWHYNYIRNQNGVYTICTSTIDKGGIDHSSSAFRVINVDKNDNISTHLRYAFIKPQVNIVSPLNGQNSPMLISGKLPISINTYNSVSETKQVKYSLYEADNNKEISSGNINEQLTDWNWYQEINLPPNLINKKLKLDITAEYNNLQTANTSSTFVYKGDYKKITLGDNWSTLLKNAQHTGNNDSGSKDNFKQLVWINNVRTNIFMSSPLIADSKVFVGSIDDNMSKQASISAYDAHTGKSLWKYQTRNSIKNTIAYENGIVVTQDAASNLYAIDATTGKLKWEQKLILEAFPYTCEGLTISNGVVYAGTGKGLAAYQLETGNLIWRNSEWQKNEAATTTLTVAGNVLISASQWNGLYANDIKTGKFLWKITENGMSDRGASPVYTDGKLYITSRKHLFIIDPKDGTILQQKEVSANLDATSTPLVTKEEIIFGTADKGVIALDKETLAIKWNLQTYPSLIFTAPYTTTPSATVETSIVGAKNTIYFGASDGYLYTVNASTGLIINKINLGAPILNTVAISGNLLVATDYSGNIYGFVSE